MKYVIRKRCAQKITTFYRNVSKKYKHTYSLELMVKNVNDAYDSIFQIEKHFRGENLRWPGGKVITWQILTNGIMHI